MNYSMGTYSRVKHSKTKYLNTKTFQILGTMQIDCYCNTMVSLSSKTLIRFTVHIPRTIIEIQNMKVKVL